MSKAETDLDMTFAFLQRAGSWSYAAEAQEGEVRKEYFRRAADICKEALDTIENLLSGPKSYLEGQLVACLYHAWEFDLAREEGEALLAAGSAEAWRIQEVLDLMDRGVEPHFESKNDGD